MGFRLNTAEIFLIFVKVISHVNRNRTEKIECDKSSSAGRNLT